MRSLWRHSLYFCLGGARSLSLEWNMCWHFVLESPELLSKSTYFFMNYLGFGLIHGTIKKMLEEISYLPSSLSPTSCQMTQNAEMIRVRGVEAWCLGLQRKGEHESEGSQMHTLNTLELIKQTEDRMGIHSYFAKVPLPSLTLYSDTGHGSPCHFGKPISVHL